MPRPAAPPHGPVAAAMCAAVLLFGLAAMACRAPAPGGGAPAGSGDAAGAVPTEVTPAAVVAGLPFHDDDPTRVRVDLAPEGRRPFVWTLDTGANRSVLSPGAARARGVSVRRLKRTPYRRGTRLGRDVAFRVDASSSDTSARTFEHALLGGQFLEEYVLEVDFPRRRVRFLDPERYAVPERAPAAGERVLPLRVVGKRPYLPVEVEGAVVPALLDTGAPTPLLLSGRAAREAGIAVEALPTLPSFWTVLGPVEIRLHESESVRLGGSEGFGAGTVPVPVAPTGVYNLAGRAGAVVGVDLLRPYVLRIDYPRERLWLRRDGAAGPVDFLGAPYALQRRAGAFVHAGGEARHRVVAVRPETPASRIGLRRGDRPVAPAGAGPVDLADFLRRVAAEREVTVAREREGVWVDVVLPDPARAGGS